MKVSEIMSRPVITVKADFSVKQTARLLVELGISALPVVDADEALVGIVSDADMLPIEARPDPRSQATPLAPTSRKSPSSVAQIMNRDVLTITPNIAVSQAARIMLEAGVKRLPVVRGRHVVGIVSRGDLVKVLARRDIDIETEIAHRLADLGLEAGRDGVRVAGAVATIQLRNQGPDRRLAESTALTVPGVLEVRFSAPAATSRRGR